MMRKPSQIDSCTAKTPEQQRKESLIRARKNCTLYSPFFGISAKAEFVPSVATYFNLYLKNDNSTEIPWSMVFRILLVTIYGKESQFLKLMLSVADQTNSTVASQPLDRNSNVASAYQAFINKTSSFNNDIEIFDKVQLFYPTKLLELAIRTLNFSLHYYLTKAGYLIEKRINDKSQPMLPFQKICGYSALFLLGTVRLLLQVSLGIPSFMIRSIASPIKLLSDCREIHRSVSYSKFFEGVRQRVSSHCSNSSNEDNETVCESSSPPPTMRTLSPTISSLISRIST